MPEPEEMMKRQQVLADFGEFAIGSEDLDDVLTEACRLVAEAMGTSRAKVLEIQDGRQELLVRAGVGWAPGVVGKVRLPMHERSSETYSIKAGEPVVTQDINQEERFVVPEFMQDAGVVALANVPIFVPGRRPYGILQVDDTKPRKFGEDEVQFLRTYATILGPVIDRLKLAGERQQFDEQRARDLAALQELQRVSAEIVGGHDPQGLYQRIVDAAAILTHSDAASIQALEPESGKLKLLTSRGLHADSVAFWSEVDANSPSACGRALKAGERIIVPDVGKLGGDEENVEPYRRSDLLSVQSTPLRAFNGEVVGMLSTHWRKHGGAASEDFHYFDILVRLAADLLERIQSTDRLRESDARQRLLIGSWAQAVWEANADGVIVIDSPSWRAYTGQTLNEWLGYGWLDAVHPDDRAYAERQWREAVAAHDLVNAEFRLRSPDGGWHWINVRAAPVLDAEGHIEKWAGMNIDIHDSKLAREALNQSEAFSRALVEGVPQLVWRAKDTGNWTWASPQWTAFTGQPEPESHGLGWLDPVHPDDREDAMRCWNEAVETGRLEMEGRIRQVATGKYRWFQMRAHPVHDGGGAIVEWLGTSTDVDDLRRMQDRQQVLVGELQHRVRNVLTIVRSVFTRTAEADAPLDQVIDHFRGRLDNLARTQVVVTQNPEGLVDLRGLIFDELLSVGFAESPNVILDGPDVALDCQTAESIGLAIHELTTNAVKYGALKVAGAKLAVTWLTNSDYGDTRTLNLTWTEQGVPVVPLKPARQGFGSELIEEALPYRLGAETKLEFRGGGVRCFISVPLPDETVSAQSWETA